MKKTKGFLTEFKEFAIKGNAFDLAVGVVIGAAFGKIVTSIVTDIITPIISLITGASQFSELKLVMRKATADTAELTLNYGNFLQSLIDFIIISFCIFLIVKFINRLNRRPEEKPAEAPAIPEDVLLLREIRDELREKK